MSALLVDHAEVAFDLIDASTLEPAMRQAMQTAQAAIEQIAQLGPGERSYAAVLERLDHALAPLGQAFSVVHNLESLISTPELRAAYNRVHADVAAFHAGIPLHAGLWSALQAVADSEEVERLDPVRQRHVQTALAGFRREGADLSVGEKAELMSLSRQLAELTTTFSQNVLDDTMDFSLHLPTAARLEGLPEAAIGEARAAAERKGQDGYRLTLQMPCYQAVLTHAVDPTLREAMYRAYGSRSSAGLHDNSAHVLNILSLRKARALLLGFEDFSDLVLADRMAGTGARARSFVADLQARAALAFQREEAALLSYRRSLEGLDAPVLSPWDLAYYAERMRKAHFDLDEEALRAYFPLSRVLEGLFALCETLYGVRVIARPDLKTWHPDVRSYALHEADESGRCLGLFHIDLHPRDGKRGGAWMSPVRSASPPGVHLGIVAGNLSGPLGDGPSRLSLDEVATVFHEFGHLLHHLLSDVPVRGLAGTQVAWDFVELPSQIHENFCYAPEVLKDIAGHWQSGEALPAALFDAMSRARTFRAATAMMRQLAFAELDLALHSAYDPERDGDVLSYSRAIIQRGTPAPLPDGHSTVTAFTHVFASSVGYASGYYSYKWAEVLDADAFETLAPGDGVHPERGRRFRETVLSKGNSAAPEDLYSAFVGRAPSLEPLLRRSGLVAD
ncbi:MAG: M3 family peptidase [Myxococcales bacterium]|nr:M3 family peptidase [Myxococcales bacterium]